MPVKKNTQLLTGIVFIAAACALVAVYGSDPLAVRAAMSAALIGIFLLFVNYKDTIPQKVSAATMTSAALTTSKVLLGLKVKGKGIFLPVAGDTCRAKVFVPLHESTSRVVPALLDEETVFFTEGFSKDFGALLDAPGTGIVDLYELESETEFKDTDGEMMCGTIKIAEGLDIATGVDADLEGDLLKITFSHGPYGEMCKMLRHQRKQLCTQACCPICASLLESFARALGKPVQISEVRRKGAKIFIRAKVLEWSE